MHLHLNHAPGAAHVNSAARVRMALQHLKMHGVTAYKHWNVCNGCNSELVLQQTCSFTSQSKLPGVPLLLLMS